MKNSVEYMGIEGLNIRSYQNGYAVYNRSHYEQAIVFHEDVRLYQNEQVGRSFTIEPHSGTVFIRHQ